MATESTIKAPRILARAKMAVIFADICRSTHLYEKLGDTQALSLVSKTFTLIHKVVKKHDGKVIRTFGDEVLCLFKHADDAGRAACAMHSMVKLDEYLSEHQLSIKIGLHFGDVILREDDIYGDAVNVAARAVGLAGKDQIITTLDTLKRIPPDTILNSRHLGKLGVKGRAEEVDFYEILWQGGQTQSMTMTMIDTMVDGLPADEPPSPTLTLTYKDNEVSLDKYKGLMYIGRSDDNDLVIPKHFVSRLHASIEYRNGKFVLADHSTNGLYLKPKNAKPIFVHREQMTLFGEGEISLGRDLNRPEAQIVQYMVKTK